MNIAISIPAAAELCGVGEPAIRRAFREGRIAPAFFLHVGGRNTVTYLNMQSAVACYGIADQKDAIIERMSAHAANFTNIEGREFLILDTTAPLMFLEPPE